MTAKAQVEYLTKVINAQKDTIDELLKENIDLKKQNRELANQIDVLPAYDAQYFVRIPTTE